MAVEPTTARIATQVAVKLMRDENARKKAIVTLISVMVAFFILITIPYYIATQPVAYFQELLIGDAEAIMAVENFKAEYDSDILLDSDIDDEIIFLGELPIPILGADIRITSKYGYRVHPVTGERRLHKGIDLVGEHHAQIIAVDDGKVVVSKLGMGYGNYIKIQHKNKIGENYYTLYAHLSSRIVQVGDIVKRGQVIALEGGDPTTDPGAGTSTGHHLHFEIHNSSGETVDPYPYLFE